MVADAAHGAQALWTGRVGLDLVPQPVHVLGDGRLALPFRLAAPHALQQLAAGKDLARVAREEGDQVELPCGQRDRALVYRDPTGARVDDETTDFAAASVAPPDRRRTDRTRAASSPGENGFTR